MGFPEQAENQSPFADVAIDGVFTSPSGKVLTMPGEGQLRAGREAAGTQGKQDEVAVVYYSAGGGAEIGFAARSARWFDPRTGKYQTAAARGSTYTAPSGRDETKRPLDYALVLKA